jgi:hypothetical protein
LVRGFFLPLMAVIFHSFTHTKAQRAQRILNQHSLKKIRSWWVMSP